MKAPTCRGIALCVFLQLLSAGCLSYGVLVVPEKRCAFVPAPPRTGAGVASVDITPPPGFATGGDGMAGGLARGHWTRLYCRAFFFETETGPKHLLMISCDLYHIPEALTRELAARLAPDGVLDAEVVLAATHTHQGPGNYSSFRIYNDYGSQYMGFSRPLYDFLLGRLVAVSQKAIKEARCHDGKVELELYRGNGPNVFLNRMPGVFVLNAKRDELMKEWSLSSIPCKRKDLEPKNDWDIEGCPRLRAIDRTITTLAVHRGGTRIGVLVFLALHPTVLDHTAALYSADFAGELVRTLERRSQTGPLVVGFFNGAEGDIVARRTTRDVRNVAEIAEKLAKRIQKLPLVAGPSPLTIDTVHDSVDAAGACCGAHEGPACVCRGGNKLASKPAIGTAGLGGGEGDRTILYTLGFNEGHFGPAEKGQGPKVWGLDSTILRVWILKFTKCLVRPSQFPPRLPLTYGRLGPLNFISVPAELTTAVGWRVREAIDPENPRDVVVVGLANSYSAYVASREEYLAQDYVGALTMWGPEEADFLVCKAKALKCALKAGEPLPSSQPWEQEYRPGTRLQRAYGTPAFLGDVRYEPLDESVNLFRDSTRRAARNLPQFSWCETVDEKLENWDFQMTSNRKVRIQERDSAGLWKDRVAVVDPKDPLYVKGDVGLDDDNGFNFVTTLMDGKCKGRRGWSATWLRPLRNESGREIKGSFRFEVQTGNAALVHSEPFDCAATTGCNTDPLPPPKAVFPCRR
jgi:neutral ceramidase